MTKQSTTDPALGVIDPTTLYTLSELKKRTRLGDWAIRKARKAGMRVRKIGNQRYVFGKDFHTFVENVGTDTD